MTPLLNLLTFATPSSFRVRTGLLLLLVLWSLPSLAQRERKTSSATRIADQYFDREEYFQAAEYYRKALEANPENDYAAFQLGEAYRAYFAYDQAEAAYRQAKQVRGAYGLQATFWYAMMLKLNSKYSDAKIVFEDFLDRFQPATPAEEALRARAVLENNGCTLALQELKKPEPDHQFKALSAPVNTPNAEYAPAIYEHDSSLVFTSARPGSKGDDVDNRTGQIYSDLYRYEKLGTQWKADTTDDQFQRINTIRNDGAGVFNQDRTKFYYTSCWENQGECALYVTTLVEGRWSKPERLNENVNFPRYDTKQPSLTPSGDTLFFVSPRPGGFGQNDLWYSVKSGDGENWEKAVNLGGEINTPFEEISPCYYAPERTLFFASNGHEGFGGLDIFAARGDSWNEVDNLGLPFNSSRDDFYFVLGDAWGYLSSNREKGAGSDDLYRFRRESEESLIASIDKDSTEEFESVTISGKIVDEDTKEPLPDVKVNLNNQDNQPIKTTSTDDSGVFKFKNLPADSAYQVSVDEDSDPSRRRQLLIDGMDVEGSTAAASKLLFENIYFDFDKYDLRPEARKVLDEIIAYSKGNPHVQIEMNANTDNIGSDEYNEKLSTQRGQAARDYLIAHGLKKSDLVIDARGEGNPLVSNATRTGRQVNRRVEFYVIGGPDFVANAMVYVVQPGETLMSIAKRLNQKKADLMRMNNLTDETVEAYQPLRVVRAGNNIIAPQTMDVINGTEANDGYYEVEEGMTLYSIARRFNLSVEQLKAINNLTSNEIRVGQRLRIK
ncbi:Outer membrane protein OmpA [Catalinimonas alkaloidigena]|uniref:Outer membrane protein OmpA n=1 Tax=Catalinimonas alkaloidigena TaxID=1075417 RepID=A0A1G9GY35_9BACT|nr:LysM peptidoglycan-binding domain-containing protein [Catalinimonas alkaloidigena]SDL05505.1 Outer membrane protein OmpA [Catalinimonas alkaloidigena]